jgi:hypothetical protein
MPLITDSEMEDFDRAILGAVSGWLRDDSLTRLRALAEATDLNANWLPPP